MADRLFQLYLRVRTGRKGRFGRLAVGSRPVWHRLLAGVLVGIFAFNTAAAASAQTVTLVPSNPPVVAPGQPKLPPAQPELPGGGVVEPQGVKTRIIKESLQAIARYLRHHIDDFIDLISDYTSTTVQNAIRKHAGKIADFLDKLCQYEELTLNWVQDQISGFLISIGIHSPTARTIGWIIRKVIEWGLL